VSTHDIVADHPRPTAPLRTSLLDVAGRFLAARGSALALASLIAALVTFAVHGRALWNGFVEWDDHANFLNNEHYRGLGWMHLKWMVTTVLMGQWIPLTWITLGLDYVLWGMQPFGYHLTNLALHAANAAVLVLVARRLLEAALPAYPAPVLRTGAIATALFFGVHPLRAESVAWVTERRDVLSGLFFLLAVLGSLHANAPGATRRRRWFALSVVAFGLACLSKSIVVSFPVVLLVLDIYPLRRLEARPSAWLREPGRRVLIEKIPYVLLAVGAAAMAVYAQVANRYLTPLDHLPVLDRIPVTLYSFWFYLSRTVVPLALSPLYELPARVNFLEPHFVVATLGVVAITAAAIGLRRNWPAGLAAWAAYLVMLLPVSGIVHNGHQLAHDRYSYLSCLPWAMLFGGAAASVLVLARQGIVRPSVARAAIAGGVLWLVGLGAMTFHQVAIWRDSESLWRYALEADDDCAICHSNLGMALYHQKLLEPAIERYERSIALRPDRVRTHGSLGLALMASHRPEAAVPQFEKVLVKYPHDADTRVNLALALIQVGRPEGAIDHLQAVLAREPDHALALTNLGSVHLERGEPARALPHLERATRLKPVMPQPRIGMVRTLVALGRLDEAHAHLEVLRAIGSPAAEYLAPALLTAW
jgi:tetratricopeptide (TPR) repeat protein